MSKIIKLICCLTLLNPLAGLSVGVTVSGPLALGTPTPSGTSINISYKMDAIFDPIEECSPGGCTLGFMLAQVTKGGGYEWVGSWTNSLRTPPGTTNPDKILAEWNKLNVPLTYNSAVTIPDGYIGTPLVWGFFYMVGQHDTFSWGAALTAVPGVRPIPLNTERVTDCVIIPQDQNVDFKEMKNDEMKSKHLVIATRTRYCKQIKIKLKDDVEKKYNNGPQVTLKLASKNMKADVDYTISSPGPTIDIDVEITTTSATIGGEYNYNKIIVLEPF